MREESLDRVLRRFDFYQLGEGGGGEVRERGRNWESEVLDKLREWKYS